MPKHTKTNKYGRSFQAHIELRGKKAIGGEAKQARALEAFVQSNPAYVAQAMADLEKRRIAAALARQATATFDYPFGFSYEVVARQNAEVRELVYLEANHSPPNDAYFGTPYADTTAYATRPAHAMLFYHHRSPRGSVGGLTSTGGSSFNKPWAEQLRALMVQGKFAEAMALDFNDVLGTTTPNRGFYALALHRAALYARSVDLIDDAGLEHVTRVYGHLLLGTALGEAVTDADEAT